MTAKAHRGLVEREGEAVMVRFTIEGPPVPKARARVAAGRGYTPKRTRDYERHVHLMGLAARPRGWPLDATYRLHCTVHPANRRSFDASNVLKSIEDGLQLALYRDDKQVRVTGCQIESPDPVRPRVEVMLEVLT